MFSMKEWKKERIKNFTNEQQNYYSNRCNGNRVNRAWFDSWFIVCICLVMHLEMHLTSSTIDCKCKFIWVLFIQHRRHYHHHIQWQILFNGAISNLLFSIIRFAVFFVWSIEHYWQWIVYHWTINHCLYATETCTETQLRTF